MKKYQSSQDKKYGRKCRDIFDICSKYLSKKYDYKIS